MHRCTSRKVRIFDAAGTVVDFGGRAILLAIQRLFDTHKIDVPPETIRKFTGYQKSAHLKAVLEEPYVMNQWRTYYNKPSESDVFDLECKLSSYLKEAIAKTESIEGVEDLLHKMKDTGYLLGVTSGYNRCHLDLALKPLLYGPGKDKCLFDYTLASDEVTKGERRPSPEIIRNVLRVFNAHPSDALYFDDTRPGLVSAQHANVRAYGLRASSAYFGYQSKDFWRATNKEIDNYETQTVGFKSFPTLPHALNHLEKET